MEAAGGHHQRRISRLDDVSKFSASLDAVKVTSSRTGSVISQPPASEPEAVKEAEEDEERELPAVEVS